MLFSNGWMGGSKEHEYNYLRYTNGEMYKQGTFFRIKF